MKNILVFIMIMTMLTSSVIPAMAEGQGKGNDQDKGNPNQGQAACENASDKSKTTQKNPHCSASGGAADLLPQNGAGYSTSGNTLVSLILSPLAINLGPDTAVNTIIKVTNLSPDIATFIPPANCVGDGLMLTCSVGDVPELVGLPANIQMNIIQNSLPFEFQYHIEVSSDTPDPNLNNNDEVASVFIVV